MLLPKRVKHRRQFRGSMAGKATRGNRITNGEYGIVAREALRLATHKLPCKCKIVSRADLEGGDNSEN